jgi:phosphoglycolate phosphatase-like HAD superfamily hydrolase
MTGSLPLTRRLFGSLVLAGAAATAHAETTDDPLPSWHDGAAKRAIIDFVRKTTTRGSGTFVPPEERIATFDQDGTLWVEQPIYAQIVYCFDRVHAVVKAKPDLAHVPPFSTVLSGDRAAIARLSKEDLIKILAATLTGMSVEAFEAEVKAWLERARDPRWRRPYTDLTYQPMQDVLRYLRANGFKTYIVTGGGQDFVRVYAEPVYGIPPEQVVGTAAGTTYSYDREGRQAGRHPPDDRSPPGRRLRQLDRRPRDAGVHDGRRRYAASPDLSQIAGASGL